MAVPFTRLTSRPLTLNGRGAATINFNGTTVYATSSTSDFLLSVGIESMNRAIISSGGAIFNTNGNNITINKALQGAVAGTSGFLTKTGNGILTLTGSNYYTGGTTVKPRKFGLRQ